MVRFGPFTLDPDTLELANEGQPVPLPPQPSRVLGELVRNAGRLVTREQLRDVLWPDSIVEYEKGLNTAVRQVRDALGERAETPVFVETVPRRGYRFIAPVTVLESPSRSAGLGVARWRPRSTAGWWAIAFGVVAVVVVSMLRIPAAPAPVRVLVLPFRNLTDDPALDPAAGALAEEVRSHLVALDPNRLGVIARTTAERYARSDATIAEIGDRLAVQYVVEGSVAEVGGDLRLTTRLLLAGDETPVWQQQYVGPRTNLAQSAFRIGERVVESLTGERISANNTISGPIVGDSSLHLEYLKARYFLTASTPGSMRRAADAFATVVAAAPDHAAAHAGLAEARMWLWEWDAARRAARSALALDPDLAEAHRVLGAVLLTRDFDVPAAGAHLERARALAPGRPEESNAYAFYRMLTGDPETAIAEVERVIALDPLSAVLNGDVGLFYHWAGRDRDAIRHCRLATELDSTNVWGQRCVVRAMETGGLADRVVSELAVLMAMERAPAATIAAVQTSNVPRAFSIYRAWRLEVLETLERDGAVLLARAQLHAAEGQWEDALDCLEAAIHDPSFGFVTIAVDPVFVPLRDRPRFLALLSRIGLRAV